MTPDEIKQQMLASSINLGGAHPAMPPNRDLPSPSEKEPAWVNTLGMPFVSIPRFETLFCIWPVRVQDYKDFCMDTGATYPSIGFQQQPDHPIVSVSWDDASEFCGWLTRKERSEGKIDKKTVYRLPTDLEWSAAVGLPHESGSTPQERREMQAPGYPWGLKWPPPTGAGNYAPSFKVDTFEFTSPVGIFPANAFGLYDMGGNVWEWCMDWYEPSDKCRVLRGGSWNGSFDILLLSSFRHSFAPNIRSDFCGFRCVLAGESLRPLTSVMTMPERRPRKSLWLAFALAILLGPLGLLYVSWKRAVVMLLVFIVGVSLIPNNGFVTLLLWLFAPVASILVLGVGSRQPPPA